jgi:hypothetical protein
LVLDLGRLTNLARRRRWQRLQRWDFKRWWRRWRALSPRLYPEDAGARLENIGEEPIQEGGILFGIHAKSPNVGELKHTVEEGSALHAAIGAVAAHVAPPILASFCSHFGLVVIVLFEERPRYTNKKANVKLLWHARVVGLGLLYLPQRAQHNHPPLVQRFEHHSFASVGLAQLK